MRSMVRAESAFGPSFKGAGDEHGRGTSLIGVTECSGCAGAGFPAPGEGIAGEHRFRGRPEGRRSERLVEGPTAGSIVPDASCPECRLARSFDWEVGPNQPLQM